jgi:hypothetical protein
MSRISVSDTHDHLVRDGEPWFYLADTVWAAFANLPIARWANYLVYRHAQGFNAVQISILPITHDTSTSPDSLAPFLLDPQGHWRPYRRNEAYFAKAERIVAMAAEAGITPVLGVIWKCHVPGTLASQRSPIPSALPLDAAMDYVEHVAQRFKPYDPIWFISGDTVWDSDHEPIYYMEALEVVRRICPESLITMHMGTQAMLPEAFAERVDFYMFQSGHGVDQTTPYRWAQRHNTYPIKRPVVNGEPCYEGHGRMRDLSRFVAFDVRKAAWQSLLSGAKMGFTYGAHGVWSCHTVGMGFVNPTWKFMPYDWEEALRLPGAWDAAYARDVFERHGLVRTDPTPLLDREDPEVAVSASAELDLVAVYMPYAYDLGLRLDLSGYAVRAYDLAARRPLRPQVEAGETSIVRLPVVTQDVLFVAETPAA